MTLTAYSCKCYRKLIKREKHHHQDVLQNATQNKLEQTLIVFIPLLPTKDLLLLVVFRKGNLVAS